MNFNLLKDCLVWDEDYFITKNHDCPNYCKGSCLNNDQGYLNLTEAYNACKENLDCIYIAKNESTNMFHLRKYDDCDNNDNLDCYNQKWRIFYCSGY